MARYLRELSQIWNRFCGLAVKNKHRRFTRHPSKLLMRFIRILIQKQTNKAIHP